VPLVKGLNGPRPTCKSVEGIQYDVRLDCCSIAYSTTYSLANVQTTTTTRFGLTTTTTKATQPTPNKLPFRQFHRFGISTGSCIRARPLFRESIPLSFLQSPCDHSTQLPVSRLLDSTSASTTQANAHEDFTVDVCTFVVLHSRSRK